MENRIATTLEQSKKLIELGIDVKTADICWSIDIPDLPTLLAYPITDCDNWENKISAWSLSALLELIPKEHHPELMLNAHYKWICNIYKPASFTYKPTVGDNPLDAAFEMIVWLKENGKI